MRTQKLALAGLLLMWLVFSAAYLPFLDVAIVAVYFLKIPHSIRARYG